MDCCSPVYDSAWNKLIRPQLYHKSKDITITHTILGNRNSSIQVVFYNEGDLQVCSSPVTQKVRLILKQEKLVYFRENLTVRLISYL